jgi:uncharacterized membrane protein YphA (DoxX/SURF4 family)
MSSSPWITLLVRFTLGIVFLAHAINKLSDYSGTVVGIAGRFSEAWLPTFSVSMFAYVLPVWELAVSVLLLLGLWYRGTLIATGVLIALLTFGQVAQGNPAGAAGNLAYFIVILIGLHSSDSNRWAVGKPQRA